MVPEIFYESTWKYYLTYISVEAVLLCLAYVLPKAVWRNTREFIKEKLWYAFPIALIVIWFVFHTSILLALELTLKADNHISISSREIVIHKMATYDFLFHKEPAHDVVIPMRKVCRFRVVPIYLKGAYDRNDNRLIDGYKELKITYESQNGSDTQLLTESVDLSTYATDDQYRIREVMAHCSSIAWELEADTEE